MTKEEFMALPKSEAVKVAFKMLRHQKITLEQFDRMMRSIEVRQQNRLLNDVMEVFEIKEE